MKAVDEQDLEHNAVRLQSSLQLSNNAEDPRALSTIANRARREALCCERWQVPDQDPILLYRRLEDRAVSRVRSKP